MFCFTKKFVVTLLFCCYCYKEGRGRPIAWWVASSRHESPRDAMQQQELPRMYSPGYGGVGGGLLVMAFIFISFSLPADMYIFSFYLDSVCLLCFTKLGDST